MKILIVVDVQKDFVKGSLGNKEAENIIAKVKEKIFTFDGEVIYTKDTHNIDYLNTMEGRNLPVEHCIINTDGWEIEDGIYNGKSKIIEKNTFGSEKLIEYLKEINKSDEIDYIEIIGISTDICVISNVLLVKTYFPEIKIAVDRNCCAGTSIENNNKALDIMKMCHIEII